MENKNTHRCAKCSVELREGMDAIQVSDGLIGMRDFVPLEEALVFCSLACMMDYFENTRSNDGLKKAPRRIP